MNTGTGRGSRPGRQHRGVTVAAVLALLAAALLPAEVDARSVTGRSDDGDGGGCPVEPAEAEFDDDAGIPDAHADSVDCAAFFSIARGYPDGTYRAEARVQRDQMASFIARTLEAGDVSLPPTEEGGRFADVARASPHADDITRLRAAGVVLGGPAGRGSDEYGPKLHVRRDQMASYLVRAAEYAYDEVFASHTQYFPDVPPSNVHFENVNFGVENDTILGFDAGLFEEDHFDEPFRPRLETRRDQMASFVVRLLGFLTVPVEVAVTGHKPDPAAVGETVTVTATVFTQFRGVAGSEGRFPDGESVTFATAPDAAATPQTGTVRSDGEGRADFSFVPHQTGTVSVTASAPGPGGSFARSDGDRDTETVRVEGPGG